MWSTVHGAETINFVHQAELRTGALHAVVCYHTLIVYKVCDDVVHCVRNGSYSLQNVECKVSGCDIILFQ